LLRQRQLLTTPTLVAHTAQAPTLWSSLMETSNQTIILTCSTWHVVEQKGDLMMDCLAAWQSLLSGDP
jgi:hypothetical protein